MDAIIRIGVLVTAVVILGASGWLGYSGVGAVSADAKPASVRSGSGGGVFVGGGRIK